MGAGLDRVQGGGVATVLGLVIVGSVAGPAVAQPSPDEHHVDAPPDPGQREPDLLVNLDLGAVIPLEANDLCPGDSICVLGAGATISGEIERRWPFGVGVILGYSGWFVDSGGVFELGVMHIIRAALRYTFDTGQLFHPSVHVGAGALAFGDAVVPSTVGGALDFGAAAELELSESVSLTGGLSGWLFTTYPFTTGRDRARRGGLGLNAALQVHLGLSILTIGSD